MGSIKEKAQDMNPNAEAQRMEDFIKRTGNVYEALAIINKRSTELNKQLKKELQRKLDEFAAVSDSIEEIEENKEQVEISKFYERLPNPAIIATNEFLADELLYKYVDSEDEKEDEIS